LGTDHGTIRRVAEQFGIGTESQRGWAKCSRVDAKPGLSSQDVGSIKENRELKRRTRLEVGVGFLLMCAAGGW
jgi:transposase-like protein